MSLCYKDKSFCSASEQCRNKECYRYFGKEQQEDAKKWWDTFGVWEGKPEEAPIAFMDFSANCGYFDLSQMTKEQLIGQVMHLREKLERLEKQE